MNRQILNLLLASFLAVFIISCDSNSKVKEKAVNFLDKQQFTVKASEETVIETEDGIVLAIPENAFVDENGKPVSGEVTVNVQEALKAEDIVLSGLSTTSNGEELETGGMFNITAIKVDKKLTLAPGKEILVDVPAEEFKEGMQLFSGETLEDGTINWVEPKPIEKFLNPVDIHSLNFYPPNFESKLAELGLGEKNKTFKDSLYYSFFCIDPRQAKTVELKDGTLCSAIVSNDSPESSFAEWNTSLEDLGNEVYRVKYNFNIPKGYVMYHSSPADGPVALSVKFRTSENIQPVSKLFMPSPKSTYDPHFEMNLKTLSGKFEIYQDFKLISEGENFINSDLEYMLCDDEKCFPPYNSSCSTILPKKGASFKTGDEAAYICQGIHPKHIQAIWQDKFNNTNLATKEFEERLQEIFKSCKKELLDVYIEHLDKPLYYSDSIATLSHPSFKQFYDRKDGRVEVTSNLAKRLNKHYENKAKLYEEAAKKAYQKIIKEQEELNLESIEKTREAQLNDLKRKANNYKQELEMNLDEAYRQLGKQRPAPLPPSRYRSSIGNLGWNNVDRYVIESTTNRTTLDYTDPNSGKKAVIKYEPLMVNVNDVNSYDRIYCYVVGNKQNSFMRMKKTANQFSFKLNELIQYNVICVAYKGKDLFLGNIELVQPNTYDLVLSKGNKRELKKLLKTNSNKQSASDIQADLKFKEFIQKDAMRKQAFRDDQELRRILYQVVFPCETFEEEEPVVGY